MENKMATFYHEESNTSYLRWLDQNSQGFVANFGRYSSNVTTIHKATCSAVKASNAIGEYGKHCFQLKSQMLAYAKHLDDDALGCEKCSCADLIGPIRSLRK